MGQGASGALALILFWLAFICFYVAFHPGGIQVNGHPAQNPRDVILWLMQRVTQGAPDIPTKDATVLWRS
jgi:hypothetical protein